MSGLHVLTIVLGDLGRSPRMQYHAQMFADQKGVKNVTAVGYDGEKCISALDNHDKVVVKRFRAFDAERLFLSIFGVWLTKRLNILRVSVKAISCVLYLFWILMFTPKYDIVLIQNPPCLPALIAALIVSVFRKNQVWIDWHNLGFTMFQRGSVLSKLSFLLEKFLAQFCSVHFCVSASMKQWLEKELGINARVLYDRPSQRFSKHEIALGDRHSLLKKLRLMESILPVMVGGLKATEQSVAEERTVQTYKDEHGEIKMREDRARILISSTSWTEDEDFTILLRSLLKLNKILATNARQRSPVKGYNPFQSAPVLVIITGKGPLKELFLEEYAKVKDTLTYVAIHTPWLEPEDYPNLMRCADIGVCLHTSTSGLDLPMKVLDMFGSGVPVLALNYPAISEILRDGENGFIFREDTDAKNSHKMDLCEDYDLRSKLPTLFDCLVKVFCRVKSKEKTDELRKYVLDSVVPGWEETWMSTVGKILNPVPVRKLTSTKKAVNIKK